MTKTKLAPTNRIIPLVAALLVVACMFIVFCPTHAYAETLYSVDVTDYGADGSDELSDYNAIQKCLNLAKNNSDYTATNPLVVNVPSGTYYLSQTLYIYSNTTLNVSPYATIEMFVSGTASQYYLLRNAHTHTVWTNNTSLYNGSTSVCTAENCGGYTQGCNITVQGGTWKQADDATSETGIMSFRHCKNVTISDMTCYYATCHFFNMAASYKVHIDNVDFRDALTFTGKTNYTAVEAVHLDSAESSGEPYLYPADGTPCKYVYITNCIFKNVHAGVGNHHPEEESFGKYIHVEDCTFTNIESHAISFDHFKYAYAVNNSAALVKEFATVDSSSYVYIKNNYAYSTTSSFVKGYDATGLYVTYNNFNTCSTDDTVNPHGLYFDTCTGSTKYNKIQNVPGIGVYYKNGGKATISYNTIKHCDDIGIRVVGTSSAPFTATITYNTLSKNSTTDIRIAEYVQNSTVKLNTVQKQISVSSTGVTTFTNSKNTYTPLVATKIASASKATKGVTVKWGKNTSMTGYLVMRSKDGGSTWTVIKTITSNTTTSYNDTSATKTGQKYSYKIVGYKTYSGISYRAKASSVKSVTR